MEAAVKTHSAHTLVVQFDLQTRLFNNVLDGVTDEAANYRPSDTVNHLKWLAGHLTSTRFSMGRLGGLDAQDPWADLFGPGHGVRDDADYPSLDAIKAQWNAISGPIREGLARLPDAVLSSPAPTRLPVGDDTMGGMLAFLVHHEAYHLGQMGLLRKYLGYDAMKYA